MEVHIYSVKDKSQASNIRVKDIMKTARDLNNLLIAGKFSRGPQVQERALLGLHICM